MAKKISVMNQKGGVGKSTLAHTIATTLNSLGSKVLILDMDVQNDQIKLAPIKARADRDKSMSAILLKQYSVKECITNIMAGLDLIQSGGKSLEAFNTKYKGISNESVVLKEALKEIENDYDYIIIDSSPTFSLIHQNILVYADYVISPCDMDNLSLSATRSTVHLIENLQKKVDGIANFMGIIPVRFDARRNLDNIILNDLYSLEDNNLLLSGVVFTPVRESSKLKTAVAKKKTLKKAFPNDKVTVELETIAKEIINKSASAVNANSKKITNEARA
jgi:chromosome partitioning protein